MRDRPSWDQTWMTVAETIGRRSRCVMAQVGAVVVTHDNRVAAAAYNGAARGLQLEGNCDRWCPRAQPGADRSADYGSCESIHAEANAIARADFTDIGGGTIYVSRASCINCAKQVANSGIERVVHQVTRDDLHRKPDEVEAYLKRAGLEVVRVMSLV